MKKWKILNTAKIQEVLPCLLENRGLKTRVEIEEFLNPSLTSVTIKSVAINPSELKKAVTRITTAIKDKESIVVYTDYDVDGLCAGAIIWETLYNLGAKVMPYVPHRVSEGYGLSRKGIDQIYKEYPQLSLIITVDHGVSAREQVEYAKSFGIDVIITDHHLPPTQLPKAMAIIHTTALSGSGVAWILSQALVQKSNNQTEYLDLVALATIADMVPLTGVNRTLVTFGLKALNQTNRLGLQAILKESSLTAGSIGSYEVGRVIAPRINAMGRMTHGLDALRLLCTTNRARAHDLALKLALTNRERQMLTEQTILSAKDYLVTKHKSNVGKAKILFIQSESYNQGIIGLVAGKIVEEYYRPAIVIARGETYSKASARSISGFNIVEAIRAVGDLLVDCGGHPMAAGFTVETRNLSRFEKRLEEIAEKELDEDKLTRVLKIDCLLDATQINWDFYKAIIRLEPFGLGNPEPIFATEGLRVNDMRLVGNNGKHLKLRLSQPANAVSEESEAIFDAIAFNMGQLSKDLSRDQFIDVAYTIDVDRWNGKQKLQLKIKDIQLANKAKN